MFNHPMMQAKMTYLWHVFEASSTHPLTEVHREVVCLCQSSPYLVSESKARGIGMPIEGLSNRSDISFALQ